ncbi:MAG TPA: hypothetical protein DIT07_09150 [Sphingobacteriaceae bacterium]|nr:hypothetical protein [Sphingobacteriaceae bacterium]
MKSQYITDQKGSKTAVIVPLKDYEKLIAIAEEYEDIKSYDAALEKISKGESEFVSIDEVLKNMPSK